jgi:hypothetical protein
MSVQSWGAGKERGLKPLAVTVPAARQITGLGNTTIWALIKEGKLQTARAGGRTLVIYKSIEELLGVAEDEAAA